MKVLLRNVEEIVTRAELEEALASGTQLRAYAGFEPSGSVHIGHLPLIAELKELQRLGFHIIVLLADVHAYLNEKGDFEQIRATAEYNRRCFTAAGLSEETEYILGSSFQLDAEYTLDLLQLATVTTEKRARRSMDELSRSKTDRKVSQMLYPLMQAMDIAYLNIDVAVGGIDQRKIKAAFCPPRVVAGNPIMQIYKYIIFGALDAVKIERKREYGGDVTYHDYEQFERDYELGKLHPQDVKQNASQYLNELLTPVRERLGDVPKTF